MTATPIPRTLHMSIVGVRDMSLIYDPPQNRKPVQTYVLEYDLEVIKEAITKELERNGQVFYMHNNIDTLYQVSARLAKDLPDVSIGVAHGQMPKKDLEDVMDIAAGNKTSIAVTGNGDCYVWGDNTSTKLGISGAKTNPTSCL